jgi:hypothetical protein
MVGLNVACRPVWLAGCAPKHLALHAALRGCCIVHLHVLRGKYGVNGSAAPTSPLRPQNQEVLQLAAGTTMTLALVSCEC